VFFVFLWRSALLDTNVCLCSNYCFLLLFFPLQLKRLQLIRIELCQKQVWLSSWPKMSFNNLLCLKYVFHNNLLNSYVVHSIVFLLWHAINFSALQCFVLFIAFPILCHLSHRNAWINLLTHLSVFGWLFDCCRHNLFHRINFEIGVLNIVQQLPCFVETLLIQSKLRHRLLFHGVAYVWVLFAMFETNITIWQIAKWSNTVVLNFFSTTPLLNNCLLFQAPLTFDKL